ncbi:response regulator [Dyadobacter diqingensis]|uniref:response regulator n=1 Tax=Dyadobacter diqingensis TaxID=2938121 RepID=UPI0020C4F365|nr:response regulator [Dyadobacter diqingensis]
MDQDIRIYLTDDDEDDRFFLREAFESLVPSAKIVEASDGLELIEQLNNRVDQKCFSLIFLDMNMPRLNGLEALRQIKERPDSKGIPVFMLSTSIDSQLINSAYELGVNSFITKPSRISEYERIVNGIKLCFIDHLLVFR